MMVASADSAIIASRTSGTLNTSTIETIEGMYDAALAKNPSNSRANFGAALFGFREVVADRNIKVIIDSLEAWDQNNNIDNTRYYLAKYFLHGVGYVTITENYNNYSWQYQEWIDPFTAFGALLSFVQNSLSSPNTIEMFQTMIDESIIGRLDAAIANMDKVLQDNEFVYTLSPAMTGEDDAMEFDLGEVYMISASLRTMRASFKIMNAYRLSVPGASSFGAYQDMTTIIPLIKTQDTSDGAFLKLRSTSILPSAKQDLLTALADIKQATVVINEETDDQSNDLIKQSDLSTANSDISTHMASDIDVPFLMGVSSVSALTDKITAMLNGSFDISANGGTQTVSVSIAAFLNNGIPDIKDVLPYHKWVDLNTLNKKFYSPLVHNDGSDMIDGVSYQRIYLEIVEDYGAAAGTDSLGTTNYYGLYGTISSTGVVTIQKTMTYNTLTWQPVYADAVPGDLSKDGAVYLNNDLQVCITAAAYSLLNSYAIVAPRDSWVAYQQLENSLLTTNYSAAHPFGVRGSDGVFSFAGTPEYTGSSSIVYLTNSSGTALAKDVFPIFPDPTFGGVFPGMTQTKLESLSN